jgi:hypothetical protein
MNIHEELEDQCGRHLVAMIDEFRDWEILECQTGSDIRLTNLASPSRIMQASEAGSR